MRTLALKRRRDIARQKWQYVAVLIAVILGVALFAGMFNAYLNLGLSLQGSYDRLVMADMTVTGADEDFIDTALEIEGVDLAIERRQADVPMLIGDDTLVGRVIGLPADSQPAINMLEMVEGSYLHSEDESGVIIEDHAAESFELEIGDTLMILDREVTIVGRAISPEYLWPAKDRQTLFTPPGTFAVVFAVETQLDPLQGPSVADQVLVSYLDDVDVEAVDSAIRRAAESAKATDVQALDDQPSNSVINEEIGALQTMAVALPVLFLAAAGMAIYVVITRLVYSQRGVIGTLRATGTTSKAMARHFRSYGVGVGLIGAIIGAVFGGLMARAMTAIYTQVFDIPDLVANFHLPTVMIALLFGVVAGFVASVPPARTVATLPPAEAMRGDTPVTGGNESLFEKLIPPLRRSPVRWRMTFRGLGRNRKRSTAMVLGVVLSAVMILAAAGSMDTMLLAFDRQFGEIQLEDAQVFLAVPVTDEVIESLEAAPGVEVAERVLNVGVTIRSGGDSYTTVLQGYDQGTVMHGFPDGLPSTGVLLGLATRELIGVEVGDTVGLDLPDLGIELTETVRGFVDEPLATLAYMESSALISSATEADESISEESLADPAFSSALVTYESAATNTAAIDSIKRVEGVAVVVDSTEIRDLIESFQLFFYVFIGMALVFGGAMAFALIFNIISVNVAERVSEFASMRANGLTHRKVASMIMGETFMLTAMGLVPGLIAGYFAAVAFIGSFSSDQFPLVAQVRPWTFVLTAMGLFVVAYLSLVPAVRAVKRINVGEVVRERAV